MSIRSLTAVVRRFADARLLVVGDIMLDQFVWGRVQRISPEAPVPVVEVTHETFHLGGAANVAHNVAALGGRAAVAGVLGQDSAGRRAIGELDALGIERSGVVRTRETVTVRKTRVIAHSQQVVRFDREQRDHPAAVADRVSRYVRRHAAEFDAVIVSDYGKGVITPAVLAELGAARRRTGLVVIVDPKRRNYEHYDGITLATPNAHETAEASGVDLVGGEESLRAAGLELIERWRADALLITRGEHGMTLVRPGGGTTHFPTTSRQVFDVTGAGDTVVATCALALAAGASLEDAARLANHAAGVVVGKLGTATASPDELVGALRGAAKEASR